MLEFSALLAQIETSGTAAVLDRIARAPISLVVAVAAIVTCIRLAVWPTLKNTCPDDRFGWYAFARFVNEICDAVVYAGLLIFMIVRPFGIQTFYIPTGSMIDTLMVNDYIIANKFAYRFSDPKNGDIVVFKPPQRALQPGTEDTDFVKRLIGSPGDVIEWKNKRLYRNGKPVQEPYVDYTYPGEPNGAVMPRNQWGMIGQADFKLVRDGDRVVPVQYTRTIVNRMPTGSSSEDESLTQCADEYVPSSPEVAAKWQNADPQPIPAGYYLFMGDNRNGSSDGRTWGLVPRDSIIGKCEFIWFPLSRLKKT